MFITPPYRARIIDELSMKKPLEGMHSEGSLLLWMVRRAMSVLIDIHYGSNTSKQEAYRLNAVIGVQTHYSWELPNTST